MLMDHVRSAAFFAPLLALFTATAAAQPEKPILSAWVQMAGDTHTEPYPQSTGHAVVRVVTSAACPVAKADDKPLRLAVREASSTNFPVTTCQAAIPSGTRHIQVGGLTLDAAPAHLQRIVILGDTGCRLKGPLVQDCNDLRRWPFPLVAARAAAKHPDLVIHVGDYYYRESPCPAAAPGCADSPHGDSWASWNADFFAPVAPLLTAAPWVFVRGNHEQCGRGADGWFRLLDAAPLPQSCNEGITAPAFTVRLDGLTLNVMDSADTDDTTAPYDLVALFNKQFAELGPATETGHGWILTHRPIWGVDPQVVGKPRPGQEDASEVGGMAPLLAGFNAVDYPVNRTEQVAADGRRLEGTDMIVSGHVHLFTALSYGAARPVQLIVGNGGDNPNVAVAGPGIRTETIDGQPANVFQLQRYGYLMMDRTKDGWIGTVFSIDDTTLGICNFAGRSSSCVLSADLPEQLGPSATK